MRPSALATIPWSGRSAMLGQSVLPRWSQGRATGEASLCYKRDFIMSLSDDKQADIIDAFNTTYSWVKAQNFQNPEL